MSEEHDIHMVPIVAHLPAEDGGFLIGDEAYEKVYEVLKDNESALAESVIAIDRFWKHARQYYRGRTKIGRNDPCFCGSGKKFKKCCGTN